MSWNRSEIIFGKTASEEVSEARRHPASHEFFFPSASKFADRSAVGLWIQLSVSQRILFAGSAYDELVFHGTRFGERARLNNLLRILRQLTFRRILAHPNRRKTIPQNKDPAQNNHSYIRTANDQPTITRRVELGSKYHVVVAHLGI